MNNRKNLLALAGLALAVGIGAFVLAYADRLPGGDTTLAAAGGSPRLVVYKSPQCGCCASWADQMEEAGFNVKVKNVSDLRPIKAKYGIRPHLETCHTAVVDGYVVEGHVPADAIKRLLDERLEVAGIVVPGMPVGSPGMEQGLPENYDHYRVLTFDGQGTTAVYERY